MMMAGHERDMSKTRSADVIPKAAAAKSDDPVIDLERYVRR